MKVIKLEKRYPGDYKGKMLDESYYDQLITESCTVVGPDGEFVAAFVKKACPTPLVAQAWKQLRDWHPKTENRGTATGVAMVNRVKQDGTVSKTRRVPKGMEVESGVVGFLDRYPRIPFCRPCSFNTQHPEAYQALIPLAQHVSKLHEELDPVGWAFQKEHCDRTHPAFVVPETIYTTMTVNKNFRTAAHLDAKNLEDGTGSMILIREGKFEGGYLVFPEWRIAVAMDTGDLVIFRNMKDFHGNTKIVGLSEEFQRCTIVFYFRDGMVHCGSPEEELEIAKNRKEGDSMV